MFKWTALLARLTESVKVNHALRDVRGGRFVWVKRRRKLGRTVLWGANMFFRWATTPVRAMTQVQQWQQWEIATYLALHAGENFFAEAEGEDGVVADELPGKNLTRFLDGGTMTPEMAAAAGRELRRAHAWEAPGYKAGWSHGDAHAGNFIWDAKRGRARLIDFEMRHSFRCSESDRQVDDVLAFLQDLMGRIERAKWAPCAEAFLEGYARPELWPKLRQQLRVPGWSPARVWWEVRCGFQPRREMEGRLAELRALAVLQPEEERQAQESRYGYGARAAAM